jgi:hypothetical protein
VTWTGTPGEGSYTVPAQTLPTSREISIPVSVIAYNLGKPVTVTYSVTRNGGDSPPSASLNLAVQTLSPGDLQDAKPKILLAENEGEGTELDLNAISGDATCWLGTWPLIAPDQDVWLRLKGTKADGTVPYDLGIWTPPPWGPRVNPTWIAEGFYTKVTAAYSYLKELKDGSTLTMEFKADLSKTTNEANAVTFPLRTYTVRAILVTPSIDVVNDLAGTPIPDGSSTTSTIVTLIGEAAPLARVEIFDGGDSQGSEQVGNTGDWRRTLIDLTRTEHRFTAKGLYGSEPVSAEYTLTVVSTVTPIIFDVRDSNGSVVGGTTVDTRVRVVGTGSSHQAIQLMDGAANIGNPIYVAADELWDTTLTELAAKDYNLKARALYGMGVPDSEIKAFSVVDALAPAITSIKDEQNVDIPDGSTTITPSVTLTGTATSGLSIELFDGIDSKGTFVATGGIWTAPNISVAPGDRSFTAKAQYGSEPVSQAWTFIVITLNDQNKPYIQQAENNGAGPILDVGSFTGNAIAKASPWPGIAAGQKVWLRCLGKKANDDDHIITLYTASPVSPSEVPDGLSKNFLHSALEVLGDNTSLTMELKVTFNGSSVEEDATVFPLRNYTVKTVALIAPTLDDIIDAKGSIVDGITVATSVTVTGTGSSGQKIQLLDGNDNIGDEITVPDNSTNWTATLSGLSPKAYSLKAKALYGTDLPDSAAKAFSVTAVLTPTIIDITDSQGSVVDGTTVEISVTVTGTGSSGQKIQLLDGDDNIGSEISIASDGTTWNTDLTELTVKTYEIKAKALYGTGVPDSAVRSFNVVAPTPELVFNTAPVTLGGKVYMLEGYPNLPAFGDGTSTYHQASGGVPGYTYSSSNAVVAVVDNGWVTVRRNGHTAITAQDSAKQSKSYDVWVTGVIVCQGLGNNDWTGASNTAAAHGMRLATMAELREIFDTYYRNWPMEDRYYWSKDQAPGGIGRYFYVKNLVTGAESSLKDQAGLFPVAALVLGLK